MQHLLPLPQPGLFHLKDTNHCTSSHDSVKLIKFADDTTLIGLISNNDEFAYRREVDRLVITEYPSKTVLKVSSPSEAGIIQNITNKQSSALACPYTADWSPYRDSPDVNAAFGVDQSPETQS
uniref:Reverse transcriptase domain-containing protein n=1 Tax=Knipowitschia caucasica TaxID=637954 RepID=A0AAV2LI33_KNICA